jgi:hypothetical protein
LSPARPLRRGAGPADDPRRRGSSVASMRATLGGGAITTLYVASYEHWAFRARVEVLERPTPLVRWCDQAGVRDAVVGGFFSRPRFEPLGHVHVNGQPRPSLPFDSPWGDVRACVQITDEGLRIARRDQLDPAPAGDLLQAGPLLVADRQVAFIDGQDAEGFSAGAGQFDSDITCGRHPRAAIAVTDDGLLLVACDGRTDHDAGMTLSELASTLVELGAVDALNLDGGGSTSLVYDGQLRNRPREAHGVDLLDGRAIVTAIVLSAR